MSPDSMKSIMILIFMIIAVLPVIYILWTKNVVRAVFSMATSFLGLAGIYVLLNAEFMAVVQILIYVGGIIVLLVFGLMLTKSSYDQGFITSHRYPILGTSISLLIFIIIARMILAADISFSSPVNYGNSLMLIGRLYLTDFIIAFELVAFLLLVALVGASYLAKRSSK